MKIIDKYIEIKNLSNPKQVFEKLDNQFIDVMYPIHYIDSSVIMLLDINIDPLKEEDIIWLKELLDTELPQIGETQYLLVPYNPPEKLN